MRVALDLTALLAQRTGVDRYLMGVVRALARVDPDTEYRVYVNREDRKQFEGLPPNFSVRATSLRRRPARFAFQQGLLPILVEARGVDVIHSPSFTVPLGPTRARRLLTVHDMTSFSQSGLHDRLRASALYRRAVRWSMRRADRISVHSEFVAKDVHRWVPGLRPKQIVVMNPGIDEVFRPRSSAEVRPVLDRLGISRPYLLFVGTIEPRKNLSGLLDAYLSREEPGERLVIAGRIGWESESTLARLREGERRGRVQLLGYVGEKDLPALYAGARLFVYPSLGEGFGFPPLEAMASGVPVVAAENSSLDENLRGAAELVPTGDTAALGDAIQRALRDTELRSSLIAAGIERASRFRWDQLGRKLVATYAELGAGARGQPSGVRA